MGNQSHEAVSKTEYEQELQHKGLITKEPAGLTPVRSGGRWFDLLTPKAYAELPDGTVVVSVVSHAERVKGHDTIDLDVRGGQLAYGLPVSDERSTRLDVVYPR